MVKKTNASRFARTNAASRSVSAVYTSGRQPYIIILCTRTLPRSSQSNVHQLARRTRCPNTAAADRADSGTRDARCSCTNGRYLYLMTAVITKITIAIRGRYLMYCKYDDHDNGNNISDERRAVIVMAAGFY